MARPLRIERPGGRYHVTARGNERKPIYRDDSDRTHFLELLGEATDRFGIRVHAYALMDNHYHLLMQTPEANLSRAMQWLNASYSMWFNRRHRRAGHLLQGRFQALIVEDDGGWQEVARYVHLNPVRLAGLSLSKQEQRVAARVGLARAPKPELVAERLARLRDFRWSSYRAYAGYAAGIGWLWRQPIARLCGGKTESERRAALREYTQAPVRQGAVERPWDRLVAGLVLGSESFARKLRQGTGANQREQPSFKGLGCSGNLAANRCRAGAEQRRELGAIQPTLRDWGRDAALWLGRRRGRYRLAELGQLAGGMDYAAVGQAVARFSRRLEQRGPLRRQIAKIEDNLSNVEM